MRPAEGVWAHLKYEVACTACKHVPADRRLRGCIHFAAGVLVFPKWMSRKKSRLTRAT